MRSIAGILEQLLICLASSVLASVNSNLKGRQLTNNSSSKDFILNAINALGLGQVWGTIQQLGSQTVLQFTQIITQLLFAGQQAWQQAQQIFAQLVQDLQNHAGDALPLVAKAVSQLNQLIQGAGKRDLISPAIHLFGLSQVWNQIQELDTLVVLQFNQLLLQILLSGQQTWIQAQSIYSQLVSHITSNNVGDNLTIVCQAISQLNQILAG